ncbi:endonuclease/exonuclease/phosphatase family protein [Halobacteriovorax marinus]|nr:endonuclease/exonuclease/phosphatase family protein [Halobacteriovorax marinus]
MKFITLIALLLLTSCIKEKNQINLLHYNIKELDSLKLRSKEDSQINAVKEVIQNFSFDILSINEMQYDLPMVPVKGLETTGQNINILAKRLGLENFSGVFYPANTGMKAKRDESGNYATNFKSTDTRKLADPEDFGIFPGQYSSGALIKNNLKIISSKNIQNLTWKEFNPAIDLTKFSDNNGNPLSERVKLFDKNLTDILVEKDGFQFHIIILHTVPAFHFGNKKSPNYQRNADQLKFLEWYLTRQTSLNIPGIEIEPLAENTPFVALGDWNTELSNTSNPGSEVLRSLSKKVQLYPTDPKLITNESPSFAPKRLQLQLDYIAVSEHFKILDAGVYRPEEMRKDLGCENIVKKDSIRSYKENEKSCYAEFSEDFLRAKEASDHFPVWAKLEVK